MFKARREAEGFKLPGGYNVHYAPATYNVSFYFGSRNNQISRIHCFGQRTKGYNYCVSSVNFLYATDSMLNVGVTC